MAVRAVGLSTQLNDKLKDESISFEDRFDLAKTVFISTTIPIAQKEDFILEYLISSFNKIDNGTKKLKVLQTIQSCICSNRMRSFGGIIRPSVINDLLLILDSVKDFDLPKGLNILTSCINDLLNVRYFQRLFACDVARLCKLMKTLYNSGANLSLDMFMESLKRFLFINKMTLLKEHMRFNFIQETYIPICSAYVAFDSYRSTELRDKIVHCVAEIVLYESTFVDALFDSSLQGVAARKDNHDMPLAVSKIKALPTECSPKVVSACYTLLLRAVLSKMKNPTEEDYKRLFRIFELFCKQLGLAVDKLHSISIGPVREWESDNSYYVISEMIDVLDAGEIPLKMEFDGYSLETWMISLVVGMTSINLTNLTSSLLDMIDAAFRLNPLIIEPCTKVIVQIMLRPKSEEAYSSYTRMMLTAIEGSKKVKRLQKFISLTIAKIRSTLMTSFDESLSLLDVIPLEVGIAFSESVETLPNPQALSCMKGLLYHLEADSLAHVETSCIDNIVVLNTEILVELIHQSIYGVKFADHTVPDIIKEKFKSELEDLQNLLRKYADISDLYQNNHNDRLLSSYLQLCHTYGAIQLLFHDYDGSPIKQLTGHDLKPTNLCYVHPYITGDQWRRIFKKILSHENCAAKPNLMRLVVQKISAVAQVEVGTEGPGSLAARYLLEVADLEWMWSHLVVLSPLFQAMELDHLIKIMVKSCKNDQSRWKTLMKEKGEKFLENRRLVLGTGLQLLHKAGKIITHSTQQKSLTSEVMSHLMFHEMLEYELSQLLTEDLELAQQLNEATLKMAALIKNSIAIKKEDKPEKIPHQSYFEVLNLLPLHHFSLLIQSCIFLSIISLLYDLPPEDSHDIHLFNILCNITDGPQRHSHKLLGHLNPGILIKFLSKRAENYPYQKELMKNICDIALKDRVTAKQLMKASSKPKKASLWITTMVIQAIKKLKKMTFEESEEESDEDESLPKKALDKKECINSLVELAIPILLKESPSSFLLLDYTVVLKQELAKKNSEHLNKLLLKLEEYSKIAIKDCLSDKAGLVEVMMLYRQDLGTYFPYFLVNLSWTYLLKETDTLPSEAVAHLVFSTANAQEFHETVTQLLTYTVSEVKNCVEKFDCRGLERVFTLWDYLVHDTFTYDKCRVRTEGLVSLVAPIIDLITSWSQGSCHLESVTILLGFYCNLMPVLSVELKPALIDTILLSLSAVPLEGNEDREVLIQRISLVVDSLFSLYLFRTNLMMDRLPALLQRYRRCLTALAPLAEPSIEDIRSAMQVAGKLERVSSTMVKRSKYFTRIAPYIIADVVGIFGKYPIHADIKNIYTNIINSFLPICNQHAIKYLKSVLPLASKELFKSIYGNYNKHHRFVGKI